jgi:hypothetical protein
MNQTVDPLVDPYEDAEIGDILNPALIFVPTGYRSAMVSQGFRVVCFRPREIRFWP